MIFQFTHALVMSGVKRQTRRLVKPGQEISAAHTCIYAFHPYRIIYEVGRKYAVQPARAAKAIARIRITSIQQEDIRRISDEDIQAEGFAHDPDEFFETWCKMHDPAILPFYTAMYRRGWLEDRPAEKYAAWVLTFCLVEAAGQSMQRLREDERE